MSEHALCTKPALPVVVTTPWRAAPDQTAFAKELAHWFDVPFAARRDQSIAELCAAWCVEVVVVAADPIKVFHLSDEHPLFFHPSMAAQRLLRLARGEPDALLTAADIRPGDTVVDATLGLAGDALVFADAVGPTGRVIGLEHSPIMAHLLMAVQHFGSTNYKDAVQILRQIEIVNMHHLDWLRGQPENSVDVVYFDPMFRRPGTSSASMMPLRAFADEAPLIAESVVEAKRVARRRVIVKERPFSGIFQMYDFVADRPRRKIAYGVWRKVNE